MFNKDTIGSRLEMLNKSTDEETANARLEQILDIIKLQDKEALKALFSVNALNDSDDFDENADCLFKFVQGDIDSWEKESGPTVFDSNDRGKVTKKVHSYYYVDSDKDRYFILLRDYPVDTKTADNVGLHLLLVVKADDRLKIYDKDQKILFDGDKDIHRTGVYVPFA